MTPSRILPRRATLRTLATAAGGALLTTAFLRVNTYRLHAYDNYGWLRGFSVAPSWGARIEVAWLAYNGTRMREELAPAKNLHANCIRLWIEFTAWVSNPEKVTANFSQCRSRDRRSQSSGDRSLVKTQ